MWRLADRLDAHQVGHGGGVADGGAAYAAVEGVKAPFIKGEHAAFDPLVNLKAVEPPLAADLSAGECPVVGFALHVSRMHADEAGELFQAHAEVRHGAAFPR